MKRWAILATLLLLACWMLPASEPEATLPAPSSEPPMVPLSICEEELTRLEQKSLEQVTKLETDFEVRLREAVRTGAADAVRPVLVELARVERKMVAWRAVSAGLGVFALGITGLAAALAAILGTPLPP